MIIYHGSDLIVKRPEILRSNRLLDSVYLTVKLFETGVLDIQEAARRLKVENLFDQILFHTEESLKFCIFERYEDLGEDVYG